MIKTIFKSIGAVLAGWTTGALLSVGSDFLLDHLGLISMDNFKATALAVVVLIIIYRFLFNTAGCYLTAALAPLKPMNHVIFIGVTGTIIGVIGSYFMWDEAVAWYNISIILISLPSAWLGGKLYLIKIKKDGKRN